MKQVSLIFIISFFLSINVLAYEESYSCIYHDSIVMENDKIVDKVEAKDIEIIINLDQGKFIKAFGYNDQAKVDYDSFNSSLEWLHYPSSGEKIIFAAGKFTPGGKYSTYTFRTGYKTYPKNFKAIVWHCLKTKQ